MRLNQASVLLVDDEPVLRALFSKWMLAVGCATVHTAGDGEAALAVVRRCAIDLVVTDVVMPVLDGVGLVRCLAKDVKRRVPSLIFVSGYNTVDKREMHDLGVEAFLTKPFEHAELLQALESALAERQELWRAEMATKPSQSILLRVKELAHEAREDAVGLGRGGFSALPPTPLSLGRVAFDCLVEDGGRQMAGEGYVRWRSSKDGRVGIEFAHLHPCCHGWLTQEIADRGPRSFIPGC